MSAKLVVDTSDGKTFYRATFDQVADGEVKEEELGIHLSLEMDLTKEVQHRTVSRTTFGDDITALICMLVARRPEVYLLLEAYDQGDFHLSVEDLAPIATAKLEMSEYVE